MVRPANFAYNEESAENNAFMRPAERLSPQEIVERAKVEFDGLVAALRAVGTEVIVIEDTPLPRKPDAVFPNNWFSTHSDGTMCTYPMYAVSRRLERANPVLQTLRTTHEVTREIAFEETEAQDVFLEGTGSLVLDRFNRIAYACTSDRTDADLARRWAEVMQYEMVLFEATDEEGTPVYHTNVIMAMGTYHAVICLESVAVADRPRVREALTRSGRPIIDISFEQVKRFAGNMLEVLDGEQRPRWVMSSQAYHALGEVQREVLSERQTIVHAPIEAIEQLGGGSARCMIAEIYLPPLDAKAR